MLEGHNDPMHINPYSKFVAGGVAGMIAQFCVYPLDTLKFRLQCETVAGGPTGQALLVQTARRMMMSKNGGWRTAYRGVTMGLIGMFPYSAIDMGTFELLKGAVVRYKAKRYGLHEDDIVPGSIVTGVIGAASGAFGASVVYPLNVLRTRLQTQGTAMHPPTYTGIWDVAKRTLAHEGWRGLYKGLTPNLLKVAPALSITWVVYEKSKTLLGCHRGGRERLNRMLEASTRAEVRLFEQWAGSIICQISVDQAGKSGLHGRHLRRAFGDGGTFRGPKNISARWTTCLELVLVRSIGRRDLNNFLIRKFSD